MNSHYFKSVLFFFCFIISSQVIGQTQDDFMTKMSEVYVNATDQKKSLQIAKEMYNMVEQHKDLQTYTNYLMLTQIFENQAPDKILAATCKEKSDKLLAAMTGGTIGTTSPTSDTDASSQWYNLYYPALFATTDKENASKAEQFLLKNPSIGNFNNYNYIAYAYERNADFPKAKENYARALTYIGNEKEEFHSYAYYTNFLSRSGEYLKAEEYIKKMERLSIEANELFKTSYKAEAITSKLIYYLAIGDYHTYLLAAEEQYAYFASLYKSQMECDPYPNIRFTYSAYSKEMLKDYSEAEAFWRKRDQSHYEWIECHNKKFPTNKQYPLSMLPSYLMKTGKKGALSKPLDFYIKETEAHFNSYSHYADLPINYMRAQQLGFLKAPQYHTVFKGVIEQIITTRDFRESTMPISSYAYFTMRDRLLEQSKSNYDQLFKLNIDWINDVIFSFGEKAFVTYYNSKLKEGYENYHSFVKIEKEKKSALYPQLSAQAYNNVLFTKSLSLKGTQKRKQAFLKGNDPAIVKMYNEWIEKKQQLIRHYRKSEDASTELSNSVDKDELKKLQEEVNHLENELVTKAKDFNKYLKITPIDWKTIRSQLKEGEAAIEMIRFQWRDQVYYSDTSYYAAYIITKNSQYPEVIYLPDLATDLDNKYYKLYQNSIKFKLKDKSLYKHYWEPIKEHLKGIKKIYFSPDGIFHLINLSTISNPETGQYILDEMDIHYTTSSTDVENNYMGSNVKKAVLVGRPSYKLEGTQNPLVALSEDKTRSFVRDFRNNSVNDLPGTEEEVMTIKKEMDKHTINVSYYIKEHATEDQLYKLHSPDILHIATHGYWSEAGNNATEGYRVFNAMVNSGLLLSGVVNYYSAVEYANTYDGILTAYEAQNLDLENTSLVILSACETSLGHMDAGEGVYGLQRAFRAAGAKSIMTSLWKVDDEATKEFMILFYSHYLKTNDKFEAYSVAQKGLKEKYPDPYFWGAFILTGS